MKPAILRPIGLKKPAVLGMKLGAPSIQAIQPVISSVDAHMDRVNNGIEKRRRY
jgi:hypothetical protein